MGNAAPLQSGIQLPAGPPGSPPNNDAWPGEEGGDDDDEEKSLYLLIRHHQTKEVKGVWLTHEPFKMLASSHSQIMHPNIAVGRMLALDSFGDEALTRWLSVAFQVGGGKFVGNSSALFPRLDRWLAGALIKSLKSLPELYFKVQGYVEGCTRKAEAPRGRLFLNMISRHQPSW